MVVSDCERPGFSVSNWGVNHSRAWAAAVFALLAGALLWRFETGQRRGLASPSMGAGSCTRQSSVPDHAAPALPGGRLPETSADFSTINHQPSTINLHRRRTPERVAFSELQRPDLARFTVPLPEAETLAGVNFENGRFGQCQREDGRVVRFNPEVLLVKFQALPQVAALRVEPRREWDAVQRLRARADVAFAELDVLEARQFVPNDPLLTNQWHHQVIGSYAAWELSRGGPSITIAIVDAPFQMDHPDLAAHTDPGWDVVRSAPVTNSAGSDHATLGAGMAAAVIDNALGVAGAGNCRILPLRINGYLSEMYNAVLWAADHGVRVVNIGYEGADSPTLETAGDYLQATARGVLAMSGVNGAGFLDYTNQPHIYCVAMTDAADTPKSHSGDHLDFTAPGWNVYSTTTNSGYSFASGTSFSTPLFCGVVAVLWSINPTLSPAEVIDILKNTAVDKGPPGWDLWFGWGRIDFAAAARAAEATRPAIAGLERSGRAAVLTTALKPGLSYKLWRTDDLGGSNWLPVLNAIFLTNGNILEVTDPVTEAPRAFYRLEGRND
jgi:subtilisin family serine protease